MAIPSTIFTEMVTASDRTWGTKVTDNVSKHNLLLARMKAKGKIKTVGGGYEIAEPLEYAENSTYQRYAGYDALNTNASDVLTTVRYPYRQVALHVTASGREIRMNSSKEAMLNLVQARKDNAVRTATNQFAIDLYSAGSLNEQINGLQNLIQTNGQGTVGGIDSATWTFWRNRFREAAGTNTAATPSVANAVQFKGDMNALWLSLNRGADKPDLIVMTHDFFALYEVGEQDKQRYADGGIAGPQIGMPQTPQNAMSQREAVMAAMQQRAAMAKRQGALAQMQGGMPMTAPQGMSGMMPQQPQPARQGPINRNPKTAYYQYGTPPGMAAGGLNMVRSMNVGGGADGRSDDVDALLSDGEYVIDAETVAMLGNGSSEAGASRLDQMRSSIRKHKGKNLSQGKISPDAKSPLAYLKGA